jgi:hypothetical protein
MDLKATQQKKDDEARAKADALAGRSTDLAEGIRQGKIPPQYSPQYVDTFKNTQGQLAGGTLQEKWNTYFQNNTWKDDPSDTTYDEHLKAFLKDNLGSDDPQVLKGQIPYVQQLVDNSRAQWISYHANKLQTDSLNAGGALASQQTQQAIRDGLSDPKGTNYDAIWSNLAAKRDAFIQAGHTADDWDSMIMKQMSVITLSSQDPNMLKFFDQKVPGKDYTYGETPEGSKIRLQTFDSLKSAVGENYSRTHLIEEQQRKDNLNVALSNIGRTLAANPMATIDESVLRQAEDSGRPLIRTELNDMRGNLLKGNSDPTRMQGVLTDILMNPNEDPVQTVIKAAQQGVYGRPEDMTSAITFAQSFKNNQDKLRVAMEMPVAKKWNDLFTKQTSNVNDFGDPISGVSNAGNEAMFDFRRMVNEWMVSNPNATQQQIDEQVDKTGKAISDRFTPNPDATGFGTRPAPQLYNRDPNLSFDNPFEAGSPNALMNPGTDGLNSVPEVPQSGGAITPNNPNGASGAAVPATQTPAQGAPSQATPQALPNGAPVVGPSDRQVKAFIDKMPKEQQDRMNKALQFVPGGKMDDYIRQYLTKNPNLIPASYDPNSPDYGQGDTRASGGLTADEANDYITQAVAAAKDMGQQGGSNTGVAENLKSLIGYTESNGNYNAVFGDANSKQDLGALSVDQVLAAQQAMRQRGVDSTAVGKYGIIYGTLKSLKAEGIVDGSEPFNKATQDKMADALLARRGLHDYLNGSLSQRQFALRLSQEWAALPSPNTGQSYYEGDGLNHSRVKPSAVYSALGMVPASYTQSPDNNGFGVAERGNGAGNQNFGQYNPIAKPLPQGDLSWDGRKLSEVDGLAIHHTGGNGTVQSVVDTLNKRGLGVQYIMDRDGTIYQTAPDGARFSHILTAKNGSGLNNNNAVGIEIIANDDSDVTPAQKASAQRWIDSMRQRYPNVGTNVFGHGELNPGHKDASEGMSVVNEFRRRTSPSA